MRHLSIGAAAGCAIALALVLSGASMQGQGRPAARVERVNAREAAAGEVLVKFRGTLRTEELQQLERRHDLDRLEPAGRTGITRLRSRSRSVDALLRQLAADPDVEYAEPNYIVQALAQPDDPQLPQLWGLLNTGQLINGTPGKPGADIHAADAWNVSVGSTANVVAVVDTGIDYTHPDLAPNVWSAPSAFTVTIAGATITCAAGSHGFNTLTRTCDPMDDHLHGTHVSGTIGAAGNNGTGVVGVNWTASIMGLKFLDSSGSGTLADAITAIDFAIQAKQAFSVTSAANVRILSNSWGGGGFSQALLDEINAANASDMLFVAAAGNNSLPNDFIPSYPASFNAPNVVAVAATTNTDTLAWFSNYGTSVHLGAPGVDVLSTTLRNTYTFESGTSMATPHVSGAAALVLSRCTLNTADLKATLLNTVEAVPALAGKTLTGGRLDVNSALHACIEPPTAPVLASLGGDHQVLLSWTGGTGATSFTVKRSLTSGGPYSVIAANVRTRKYTDASAVNGTTYYYVVTGVNSLGESPASNEVSATPKTPPDLIISALTAPAAGGAGLPMTITVSVKNQGAGAADPSTTRLYLSDNTLLDASDLRLPETIAVPLVAAGATFTAPVTITLPANTTMGVHVLIAQADGDNVLLESVETNNTAIRGIQIGPDLKVAAFSVPVSGAPGGTVSMSDTVTNQGGAPVPASVTRFYLSANSLLDAGDAVLAGARTVPELAAGATSAGTTLVTLPSNPGIGYFYVFAKADADNAIVESDETNNTMVTLIQIGGDLIVSALNAPTTAGAGTAIVVTDTTTNNGSATVQTSTTRFYLSTNGIVDAGDVQLDGAHVVPELAAGASHASSTTVTVPATVASGTYYLLAKADGDNAVVETQEGNNVALRQIQIGTDLLISSLGVPAKGGSGLPITITDTTKNQGGAMTPPSVTRFYLSTNVNLDSSDTLLSPGRAVPALDPGTASTGSTTVTLPAIAGGGVYYIIAKADGDNAIPESSETNNTAFASIQVGSDLVVASFSVPVNAGLAPFVVADTITNQGAGTAAASTTRYYLSGYAYLDSRAVLLSGERAVPALAAGETNTGSATVAVPDGTAAGSYYLLAKADADNVVAESQEFNNTNVRAIAIGPDLVTSGFAVPSAAAAGATISVTDVVTNQGADPADASTTRFYLSANVLLDASDVLLSGVHQVPPLAAGQSSTGVTSIVIPAGTVARYYYVIAASDADNAVRESSETNNSFARLIQVTSP